MLTRRTALEAVAFAIAISAFSSSLHADEPARRWRPATEADLPAGTVVLPGSDSPGAALPAASAGVRVHVDPATGTIVPAPADSPAEAAAAADIDAGAPPLVLKKTPSGLLYVDTSYYRHTATVAVDGQSQPKLDCEDPPQDNAAAARLAGKAPAHAAHPHAASAVASAEPEEAVASAKRAADSAAARTAAQQHRLAGLAGAAEPGAAAIAAPNAAAAARTRQATPQRTSPAADTASPPTASEQ